jgi:hypothetical protein
MSDMMTDCARAHERWEAERTQNQKTPSEPTIVYIVMDDYADMPVGAFSTRNEAKAFVNRWTDLEGENRCAFTIWDMKLGVDQPTAICVATMDATGELKQYKKVASLPEGQFPMTEQTRIEVMDEDPLYVEVASTVSAQEAERLARETMQSLLSEL